LVADGHACTCKAISLRRTEPTDSDLQRIQVFSVRNE
jgi:hypothetical protein